MPNVETTVVCDKNDPIVGFSHCRVCARKYMDDAERYIKELEEKIRVLKAWNSSSLAGDQEST